MLTILRGKLLAIGAGIIAVLLAVIKWLSISNSRIKQEKKTAEAIIERQKEIHASDTELSTDLQSHKAQIVKEIEAGEPVKELEDPNEW
jgi:hypothetical protein